MVKLIAMSFEYHLLCKVDNIIKFIILRQGYSPGLSESVLNAITYGHIIVKENACVHTHTHTI